jgi:hypothetical protein
VNGDEQKTGLFQLIIICVFVLAAISLILILSIDEPLPPDPLSELDVEVTDVVLAEGLWTNGSGPIEPVDGVTNVGLKVRVTNNNKDSIRAIRIPFQVVFEWGNVTDVIRTDVVDPRLEGGPFADYTGYQPRIEPGGSHEGWIALYQANRTMNWTEAELRIPAAVEGRKSPSTIFNITGARILKGLVSRQSITIEHIMMTDAFMDEVASRGDVLYIFHLVYVNEWPYTRVVPDGGFRLQTGNPYPASPDLVLWSGSSPVGLQVLLGPGESIDVDVVFGISHRATLKELVFSEDFYPRDYVLRIRIPLEDVDVFSDFEPKRLSVSVAGAMITDRIGARWSDEGSVFLQLEAEFENDWRMEVGMDVGNLTLVTEGAGPDYLRPLKLGMFQKVDSYYVSYNGTLAGTVVFQIEEGDVPMYLVYDDHGQLSMGEIDAGHILDIRGHPRLAIEVANLTMVDRVEGSPTRTGYKVLLVWVNVSNPWEERVEWVLDNVTFIDANGTLVDKEPRKVWIEDCIDVRETLYQGDSVEGWFQIQVPEEWTPGTLVYSDPVVDTVVDISGIEVYRPPDLLHLTVEINWYLITDRLVDDTGDEAHRFHIFNLTFNNTGSVPVGILDTWCNPYAENGSIYNKRALWFDFYNFPDIDLAPGETVVGMIAFIIPAGEIPALLEYRYGKNLRVPIDPANVTYLDFNTSVSMVINDMYWTESIGNVSSFYSDNYLVINITITNGWVEPRGFGLQYFDLVDVTGHETMYDRRSYDQLENRWEDVTIPAGSSATGVFAFDIYNGSDPDHLVFHTGPFEISVGIDPVDIRNGSGTLCMYDGDSEEGSEGPSQCHRAAWRVPDRSLRPYLHGHPVQALAVKGPDKN